VISLAPTVDATLTQGIETMLWTIVLILLVLWLLGLVSSYTLGGFIHLLLVVAIIIVIVNLVRGRKPL
jgi:Na+/H+ antiporter NhaC